jgi:hypothetical protein
MEIVSTKAPSSSASLFVDWKDDECPVSHERSLSEIDTLQFPPTPSTGLPALTAIGVNIAASADTVNEIGGWLKKYGISGSKSEVKNGKSCSVAAMTYSNGEVRYVSNPGARVGSKTVKQYEEMQMAVHKEYVGPGKLGWDAWMDNHWCVGVSHSKSLDSVAKLWAADGVAYHAHESAASSVRSVGLRGESIELNGLIDGSYLKNLDGFDFCTASTEHNGILHV